MELSAASPLAPRPLRCPLDSPGTPRARRTQRRFHSPHPRDPLAPPVPPASFASRATAAESSLRAASPHSHYPCLPLTTPVTVSPLLHRVRSRATPCASAIHRHPSHTPYLGRTAPERTTVSAACSLGGEVRPGEAALEAGGLQAGPRIPAAPDPRGGWWPRPSVSELSFSGCP